MCISKQIFSVLTILFFLNPAIKAQNLSDTINDKLLKKAVKTEIIDASGNLHSGSLVYADSSSIFVLSDKEKEAELLKIDAEQIMKLHARETHTFWRRLSYGIALSAGLSTIKLMNEAIAPPPDGSSPVIVTNRQAALILIISGGTALIDVTKTFIRSAVNIPKINIEYITEGKREEYQKIVPYISQNGIMSRRPDSAETIQTEYNEQVLLGLEKPIIDKSPQSSLPFHFNLYTTASYMSFSHIIPGGLSYGFSEQTDESFFTSRLFMKINFNLTNKLRPFVVLPSYRYYINSLSPFLARDSYTYKLLPEKDIFSFSQLNNLGHQLGFDYKSFQVAAGADYYFKTADRMLSNRFEYIAGIGLAADFLTLNSQYVIDWVYTELNNDLQQKLYGLYINGSAGYYITPHVSITAGISSNIFLGDEYKYSDLNFDLSGFDNPPYEQVNMGSLKVRSYYDLSFNLGLSIHI